MIVVPTLIWNDYALPEPIECSVEISDLDSEESGRNQGGYMFRDRVRGGATAPRKVSVRWGTLTNAEASYVLKSIGVATGKLRYPDPYTGLFRTGTFYCGNKSVPVLDRNPADGQVRWKEISVNFIEC